MIGRSTPYRMPKFMRRAAGGNAFRYHRTFAQNVSQSLPLSQFVADAAVTGKLTRRGENQIAQSRQAAQCARTAAHDQGQPGNLREAARDQCRGTI